MVSDTMEEFLQKKCKEGKHTPHTFLQETIQSPIEPKVNPPAPPAQRCEISKQQPKCSITAAVCGSCGVKEPMLCPTDDNLGNNA